MTNTRKPRFWPGTNTPRSTGNAFDWRDGKTNLQSYITEAKRTAAGQAVARARSEIGLARGEAYYITPSAKPGQRSVIAYSRAKPSL